MSHAGLVREWHPHEGWGVVDSDETPGGCWVSFAALEVSGYKSLEEGQTVELEHEPADQDGFDFRAVRVWPSGAEPVDHPLDDDASEAYRSTLSITWDDPV